METTPWYTPYHIDAPIEAGLPTRAELARGHAVRSTVWWPAEGRGVIETLLQEGLTAVLSRPRHGRRRVPGHRHGHRTRRLTGGCG